jgi:hypothetical protein
LKQAINTGKEASKAAAKEALVVEITVMEMTRQIKHIGLRNQTKVRVIYASTARGS